MSVPDTGVLLERELALGALAACLEAARAGVGGVMVVEGPAGIGKTCLLEAAREQARSEGMRVLAARGAEFERSFAFGVVRQLFEPALREQTLDRREVVLRGAAGLTRPLLMGAPDSPVPVDDRVFAVLHGLFWLCVNLAERSPVFVVLDDAHWADPPSLRFLSYLAGRMDGLAIAVVLAVRTGDPAGGELVSTLVHDPRAEVLRPAALGDGAVAQLIAAESPDPPDPRFCRACRAATGGNPFLLRELIRALRDEGIAPDATMAARVGDFAPESVARSLLVRTALISEAAVGLARALSVLEQGALSTAATLAGLDLRVAGGAADALREAEILRCDRELAFVHPIVRAAIYGDLGVAHRSRLHAEAARLLEEAGAGRERVAAHLLEAEPGAYTWAAEVLRDAARQALARGAPESAAAYLDGALKEPMTCQERARVLGELGAAEIVGHHPGAAAHLREALEHMSEPALRAATVRQLGLALFIDDQPEAMVAVLDQALTELGDVSPEIAMPIEAQLLQAAGGALGTRRLHAALLDSVRNRSLADGLGERMLLANLAGYGMVEGIPAAEVLVLAERALGNGDLLADPVAGAQLFYAAITGLIYADHFALAARWLDRAVADARSQGSLVRYACALAFRADLAYRIGHLGRAEEDSRAAVEAAGGDWVLAVFIALPPLLDALIERGQHSEAQRILDSAAVSMSGRHEMTQIHAVGARARLSVAQGRFDEGLADLRTVGRWCEAWGARNPGMFGWRSSATLALHQLGDDDEARRLAAEEVALARPLGQPRALGVALRAAGLAEASRDGIGLLREAADVLKNSGAELEYARAMTDLGAALRRSRHPAKARDPLGLGLELAHRCGATALVERARTELLATGARPRRPMVSGRDSLTPSEARVARMAAEGLTTPAIAQALFVTTKTVETHLGHAYQKLDINSRHQLAQALH